MILSTIPLTIVLFAFKANVSTYLLLIVVVISVTVLPQKYPFATFFDFLYSCDIFSHHDHSIQVVETRTTTTKQLHG